MAKTKNIFLVEHIFQFKGALYVSSTTYLQVLTTQYIKNCCHIMTKLLRNLIQGARDAL